MRGHVDFMHEFGGNAVRVARRVKLTGKILRVPDRLFRGGQKSSNLLWKLAWEPRGTGI